MERLQWGERRGQIELFVQYISISDVVLAPQLGFKVRLRPSHFLKLPAAGELQAVSPIRQGNHQLHPFRELHRFSVQGVRWRDTVGS
jgi:hypothetical protein